MTVVIKVRELDEINNLSQLTYEDYIKVSEDYTDWLREPPNRIIQHIVYTHHGYIRKEVPNVGRLLFNMLKIHGKNHQELIEIYILFSELKKQMEQHMDKEEELLFPAMRRYERSKTKENRKQLLERIDEIEVEHKAAGGTIKKIRKIASQFTVAADGLGSFEQTYRKLAEIEKYVFRHIHIIKMLYLKTYAEFVEQEGRLV